MKKLVFDGGEQRFQVLRFGGDGIETQVNVPGNRSVRGTKRF